MITLLLMKKTIEEMQEKRKKAMRDNLTMNKKNILKKQSVITLC